MEELTGLVEQIRVKRDGFIVFYMNVKSKRILVSGSDADIFESDVVTCSGAWTEYRGEKQFKAKSIIPQIPTTHDAIYDFLCSGRIKGINAGAAKKLLTALGTDLIYVAENEPERISAIKGFGPKKTKILLDGLREQIGYRSILIFLHGFGISTRIVNRIHESYGLGAVEKIKENPYSLIYEIESVGFKLADQIASRVGIKGDDPNRVMAGIYYTLNVVVNSTGSTGILRSDLERHTFNLFEETRKSVDPDVISEGVDIFLESSLVVHKEIDGQMCVFPKGMYEAEVGIATHIKRIVAAYRPAKDKHVESWIDDAQKVIGKPLDPVQREAVRMAVKVGVGVITGGPGTGKTTIVRVFLEVCQRAFGFKESDILLSAPTGKAAKRLSEASNMEAGTLHRALSYSPEDGGFCYNEDNPLEAKIIVADESSMKDTELAYAFYQAVANGAKLLIVGDVDQLASVGPGKVLMDLIDSGTVSCVRLKEIYRQAKKSRITVNAHQINKGLDIIVEHDDPENDFWFMNSSSDHDLGQKVIDMIGRFQRKFGYDPIDDIQILTPQKSGTVGQHELNRRIQKLLNPNLGKGIKVKQDKQDVEFCLGDKVIQIKNNYDLGVFNGEVGKIKSINIQARKLQVLFEARMIEYTFADFEQLRLAYAMTIHKSQGSEYPCVIVIATTSHYRMLTRNLFYTGITRGKQQVCVVGERRALQIASTRISSDSRTTGLKQHLIEIMAA
ncbi:ATP-dependent RecD-like DNA helicase [Pseudomonas syringae pv. actinidiae]|nr:ATP-dependent RecD-like DNA helicase [Pseudomonas syringae pv. actinidiae]